MTMKDISTIKKKSLKEEAAEKQKNTKIKWRFYHSFFTIVLIGCVAQLAASAFINVAKTVSHRGKISISKKLRDEAKAENDRLKKELKEASHDLDELLKDNELLLKTRMETSKNVMNTIINIAKVTNKSNATSYGAHGNYSPLDNNKNALAINRTL